LIPGRIRRQAGLGAEALAGVDAHEQPQKVLGQAIQLQPYPSIGVPRRFLIFWRVASRPQRPDSVAGVRGLELGNVGLIECAPNALVCQNIFVPESFGEGPQRDGRGSRWGPDPLSWVTFYELRASLTPSRSVLVFAFVRELARGLSGYSRRPNRS
jgi:hypothetical protein